MCLLIAYTFAVFSPSLKNGFVDWDDGAYILNNPYIQALSLDNIKALFTTQVGGNYNPLTILSFAFDYHFYGLNPFGYHLVNVLLHLANVILVYLFIRGLGASYWTGFLVAVLFAIHPLRVESVAWVTERKDLMFGLFYLIALISYLKFLRTRKVWWLVLLTLSFILSLLSKIQAVALPLSLLVIDYYLERPIKWKLLLEKTPLFLLSLATGLIGIHFLSLQQTLDRVDYSLFERVLMGFYALMVYLVKAVVPYELSTIYPFPKGGELSFLFFLSPFVILSIAGLVIYSLRKTRVVATGFLFFLVNVIFVLQVLNAGQGFIADRFTYIPLIGLFFVMAMGITRLFRDRPSWRPIVAGLFILWVFFLSFLTWNYTKAWENTATLFSHVLERYENVPAALQNRARFYRENGETEKAISDYTRVLLIKPDAASYNNRGRLYFERGNYDEAFLDFTQALRSDTTPSINNAIALLNRGAIFAMRKQYDSAIGDLSHSLRIHPEEKQAWLNLALAHYYQNQFAEAKKACDSYLALKKDDPKMINLRGLCHTQLGNFSEALADFNLCIGMDSRKPVYYQNRSNLYSLMGDKMKAEEDARTARKLTE